MAKVCMITKGLYVQHEPKRALQYCNYMAQQQYGQGKYSE